EAKKEPQAQESEKVETAEGSEEISMGVVDGIPRSSGEATYRAEVNVPRENGGAGPLGKRGLTAVRGPNRIDRQKAQEDVRTLV
ncbi:Uncharacterized protein SCF082_LOCUS43777, partial [Durusdinium trenchii]